MLAAVGAPESGVPGASELSLWYDRPADSWEAHALPLGNGPMGCMVFGGIDKEQLQFNVDSLWTGDENMVGKEAGKSKDDSYLAKGMGFYQNFGSVHITVDGRGETTGLPPPTRPGARGAHRVLHPRRRAFHPRDVLQPSGQGRHHAPDRRLRRAAARGRIVLGGRPQGADGGDGRDG